MTNEELIIFEQDIAKIYGKGQIKAPIHLRDGNESPLIQIFNNINRQDYVFSTWASHLHALLKGIPPDIIKQDILQGRSITLHYPQHNFYSSAIVGGIAPIALGVSKALSESNKSTRVFCFIGDMSFHSGIVNECIRYSIGHDLPITWIVEDNNKSVGTDTEVTCGIRTEDLYESLKDIMNKYKCNKNTDIIYYSYETSYPHSGTGVFVEF